MVSNQRASTLRALTEETLDLLVVGGGIVGAGVVRDAAMRGLKVGLVEQHDFAFGTSSRSSRLLHGGLRYLAQGRVGLVREASIEKKVIHHIAPHLAEPLPFLFPTYRGDKDWVLWQLKAGVKIYDLLCGGRNLGKSTWLNSQETLQRAPGLTESNLTGAVRYYDGFTNDARLVIDTLRSSTRAGAQIANYLQFKDAVRDEVWQCQLVDQLTSGPVVIRARTIVNATGPWAGQLPHSRVQLRLTKGIHLVLERHRLPVTDTVVMTEGKRILFAIPWGERTILGTTDTDYEGPLDQIRASAEDIGYLLGIANHFFPRAKVTQQDVISAWAGLRPLLADPSGKPSDISRSHQIRNPEPGWWDVAGGKLTTYRLMAEQTVDKVSAHLRQLNGWERTLTACRTATERLLPTEETMGVSGILPPELTRAAVEHYCLREWSVHLDDVMIRRTSWQHYFKNAEEKAEQVAQWMGSVLGWSESKRAEEIERYHSSIPWRAASSKQATAAST